MTRIRLLEDGERWIGSVNASGMVTLQWINCPLCWPVIRFYGSVKLLRQERPYAEVTVVYPSGDEQQL